jgi:LDH2 family malate/lactate/ureidoglycolate dehydrogenase
MSGGSAIHSSNTASAAGMFALTAAYNDAAGRTMCAADAPTHTFTGEVRRPHSTSPAAKAIVSTAVLFLYLLIIY